MHVTERVAARLRAAGFSPTVGHRDLAAAPQDSLEGAHGEAETSAGAQTVEAGTGI